jgi:tRNA threonylcarbamoyladenosine biosynthesis protein TsaB
MLAMDTCGTSGSVALAELTTDAGFHLVTERVLPGRETQEQLMLAISDVLATEGLVPASLDVLGVVTGPGSFTGVRIGLAAIKGLSEALNKPVVAVSRLAVLASQGPPAQPVSAWLDAGRGDVFVGRYAAGSLVSEAMFTGTDALAQRTEGEAVVVMEEALAERAPDALLVPPVSVREALPLLAAKAASRNFAEIALLDANYLRVPDAELARLRALATA